MSLSRRSAANWLDGTGMAFSTACMAHCLLLPLAIALLPAWTRWLDVPESFHAWLLAGVLPFSSLVLWREARKSRQARSALWIGLFGLGLMAVALTLTGETAERLVTGLGAVLVAGAHFSNWRGRGHGHA